MCWKGCKRIEELVPEEGFDHGENQRLMAWAAGRMVGGGREPSADSDGTRRPTRHGGAEGDAGRPPVTLTAIQRRGFTSFYINNLGDIHQMSTTEFNRKTCSTRASLILTLLSYSDNMMT